MNSILASDSNQINMDTVNFDNTKLSQLINFKFGDPINICLEVNPPRGVDFTSVLKRLKGNVAGISFINVTDSALARMRCSPFAFASILKQELGIEPLVNVSCRDRNVIALQGDLLGGSILGIKSVIALTGDAISVGDMPNAKGVFEINSVGLLDIISKLNNGFDLVGNTLKGKTDYIAGVVVNPNAKNISAELRRLEKKRLAGARYALSQPVFDLESAREFLTQANREVRIPILLGLMPLRSGDAGLGLKNIPGMKVPQDMIDECIRTGNNDFSEYSINRAIKTAEELVDLVGGFHVISGPTPLLGLKLAHILVDKFKGYKSNLSLADL